MENDCVRGRFSRWEADWERKCRCVFHVGNGSLEFFPIAGSIYFVSIKVMRQFGWGKGRVSLENVVIEVKEASVRLNLASERIDNLKEYVIKLVKKELLFQEFLALRHVDVQVKRGEAWGIIGTNGSGKSTLLKLICGIFKPYQGSVRVKGRIAPLIELGAGFDGDLTARENIFLNGAVLGYSKRTMQEQFEEIVAFAELEHFLDMPIKNYSSGMAARLGFSIATQIQPDILIVDEVLSVGDYLFQQKCEKRMQEMLKRGTTLLYVSHNMESVEKLCEYVLWLEKGEVKQCGKAAAICQSYRKQLE